MKSRKGFTLIELMIVIAIIAIIAAIAIPNLMRSRIQANEANAVAALKSYTTAQVTFQTGKQGRLTDNSGQGATGYADNFRNLFFGQPVASTTGSTATADPDRNLALINQTFANAFAEDNPMGVTIANTNGPADPITGTGGMGDPYQGYLFSEPSSLTGPDFRFKFALYGIPGNSSTNGNNAFWVAQEGTVWMKGLDPDEDAAANVLAISGSTPSDTAAAGDWITM